MSTQSTVGGIKSSLSKLLPAESLSPDDVEQVKDMLQQLDKCSMTLDLLSSTLIGTVVSKFKIHDDVGPIAKALVKKWKKVAKDSPADPSPAPTSAGASSSAAKKKKATQTTTRSPPGETSERRSSSSIGAVVAEAEVEWSGLQPHRKTTVQKLHSVLLAAKSTLLKQGINGDAVEHLAIERASDIEGKMNDKYNANHHKTDYLAKARSLFFNIKKNSDLTTQILLGQITAEELVEMSSEQLVSEEERKRREAKANQLMDSSRLDWAQANEDKINEACGIKGELLKASLFTCGRCKSIKTTSTQKQTRSADEPMTVFVLCLNCGKRWKC